MGIECCDPLDLKRELCEECPHFANCNVITKEAIQEIFEEKNDTDKNVGGRDKRDLL